MTITQTLRPQDLHAADPAVDSNVALLDGMVALAKKDAKNGGWPEIAAREKLEPERRSKAAKMQAEVSRLRQLGFTSEDPEVYKLEDEIRFLGELLARPDTILQGLIDERRYKQELFNAWTKKLSRARERQRMAAEASKPKGGKKHA